ncbi:unnamed protein product [Linum trigynum]|uniref:Uncharacterized protein n=1 Tax=Linum trigynum TaxID=586398 RepID=A0AAV2EBB6_9ROSI
MKTVTGETFSEQICKLNRSVDFLRTNLTGGDMVTDEVVVKFHVLRAFMEHGVGGNVKSLLIITIKDCGTCAGDTHMPEKCAKPDNFTNSAGHGAVLSLSRRSRDNRLLLGPPRNRGTTKGDKVTRSRPTSGLTAALVGITMSCQVKRATRREKNALTWCILEVTKNTLSTSHMRRRRRMNIAAEDINCIDNIWARDCEVL